MSVCSFGLCQTARLIFTRFGVTVARGPRKTRSDFGSNPDRVTLGRGWVWRVTVILCGSEPARCVLAAERLTPSTLGRFRPASV